MPADPIILKVGADAGKLKSTFTGLRSQFPNMAIHKVISEEFCPFREALARRSEFATPGLWEGPIVTFTQSWLDKFCNSIRGITHKDELAADTPLKERQQALAKHVERMISEESLEDIASDPNATHGDLMLQPSSPRVQTLAFDWTGNDPNYPQPTPGRFKDPSARVLITALDVLVVEMTNSPSSNGSRTVIKNDSAMWISWLADMFNIAKNAATNRNPYVPEALQRGQYDHIWNADGGSDRLLSEGDGQQGEQLGTFTAST